MELLERGDRAIALELAGRWDEAVALSTALLASADAPVYRLGPLLVLGVIRARRGEPGAWGRLDEAAAAADASGESQWIIGVRLARAEAYWLQGELHRAADETALARGRHIEYFPPELRRTTPRHTVLHSC